MWTFASARSVPVPSTAFTRSHQYRLTWAPPVIMPTHHDPFGSNVCTDVSWTFWVPPKTSWDVWTWSNVAFRMSKSTVFALPSSVVKASVVTPVSVASQRCVVWTVSIQRPGPRNESRTRVALPPNSVTFASMAVSVIVTLELGPSSRSVPGEPLAANVRALPLLVTNVPPFAT